jgi:hypothetical protein
MMHAQQRGMVEHAPRGDGKGQARACRSSQIKYLVPVIQSDVHIVLLSFSVWFWPLLFFFSVIEATSILSDEIYSKFS